MIEDIDSSPADAAWRTVKDQTTLQTTSLSVFRQGKPFSSQDSLPTGRHCIFHPFAFHTDGINDKQPDGIHMSDLDGFLKTDFGHIPYIYEGLRNIWFEIELGPTSGNILENGLQQLQQDHESGARKLAAVSLNILQAVLEHLEDPVSLEGPWWRKACLVAWHLWKNGRPSMDAAILSFLLLALREIETSLSFTSVDSMCRYSRIHSAFESVQKTIRSYTTRISHNLASYMRSKGSCSSSKPTPQRKTTFTILTLSASSTIRECIVQAALASSAPFIDVRVLESRPLFEGVTMAGSIISSFEALQNHQNGILHRPKVRVTIYTDASVAQAAAGADLLLLGADRVSPDGSVSNKTGSVPAALSIRHMAQGGETIVVSEIYKVALQTGNTAEEHAVMENNEASEVMEAWGQNDRLKGLDIIQDRFESHDSNHHDIRQSEPQPQKQSVVNVQNVYFEWVPPSLIDTYICEDGMKTTVDFQRQSQWVSEQCELFFGRY